MKVLVVGAEGFIGRNVADELDTDHDVYRGSRSAHEKDSKYVYVDLVGKKAVSALLAELMPEVIINCAGVVDQTADVTQNETFTRNLLEAITQAELHPHRIVISGSAGEYGVVGSENLPVNEDTPRSANSGYGLSKRHEIDFALDYASKNELPLVVARVFNPLGPGMHPKFLTARILQQIAEINSGERDTIEISRLDAQRDYIDVRDVAKAIKAIVENEPTHNVYNIGSGKKTSNGELIELLLKHSTFREAPAVVEVSDEAEPVFAVQADISRIKSDLGWQPTISLDETIRDIISNQ